LLELSVNDFYDGFLLGITFFSSLPFSYFLTNSSIRPYKVILGPPLDLTIDYIGALGGFGTGFGYTTTSSVSTMA
jgi:hypothetical protein